MAQKKSAAKEASMVNDKTLQVARLDSWETTRGGKWQQNYVV